MFSPKSFWLASIASSIQVKSGVSVYNNSYILVHGDYDDHNNMLILQKFAEKPITAVFSGHYHHNEIITKDYEEKNPVGRPKIKDDDIVNDNTGISSDMGNNVSEIK